MSSKKNHGRFCVQFNLNDPRHRQVVEILERQGRRKAQFIVEMVLGTAITDMASLQPLVEPIVKQLLAQNSAAATTPAPAVISNQGAGINAAVRDIMASFSG